MHVKKNLGQYRTASEESKHIPGRRSVFHDQLLTRLELAAAVYPVQREQPLDRKQRQEPQCESERQGWRLRRRLGRLQREERTGQQLAGGLEYGRPWWRRKEKVR